jgi:hypothetical protein
MVARLRIQLHLHLSANRFCQSVLSMPANLFCLLVHLSVSLFCHSVLQNVHLLSAHLAVWLFTCTSSCTSICSANLHIWQPDKISGNLANNLLPMHLSICLSAHLLDLAA